MRRLGLYGDLVLDHVLVQERRLALTEDEHQHVERRFVLVVQVDRGVAHVQERQRDVVLEGDVAVGIQGERRLVRLRHLRATRDRAVVLGHPGQGLGLVKVTADGQYRVVGAVPTQEELLQVVHVDAIEILDVADGQP